MNVGDIMTREVISVGPEATVKEAAKLMLTARVSGLPVIDDAHVLIGMVTEGDLLRRAENRTEKTRPHWLEFFMSASVLANEYVKSHARRVGDIMTRDVIVVTEDAPLEKAAALMEHGRVKRLPVLRDGRIVGIISRANLLRVLITGLPHTEVSRNDKIVREQIERDLRANIWGRLQQGQIMVKDGIVDLWGFITSDRQRDAIRVAVENVPGVRRVRDHLVWLDPHSGIVISGVADGSPPHPTAD